MEFVHCSITLPSVTLLESASGVTKVVGAAMLRVPAPEFSPAEYSGLAIESIKYASALCSSAVTCTRQLSVKFKLLTLNSLFTQPSLELLTFIRLPAVSNKPAGPILKVAFSPLRDCSRYCLAFILALK